MAVVILALTVDRASAHAVGGGGAITWRIADSGG